MRMKTMLMAVLLLAVAGLYLATGCSSGGERAQVVYVCPMHPNVAGMEGARCSTCGMPLERREVRAPNENSGGGGGGHSGSGHGGHH